MKQMYTVEWMNWAGEYGYMSARGYQSLARTVSMLGHAVVYRVGIMRPDGLLSWGGWV